MQIHLQDFERYVDYKEMYEIMERAKKSIIDIFAETENRCRELYFEGLEKGYEDTRYYQDPDGRITRMSDEEFEAELIALRAEIAHDSGLEPSDLDELEKELM